MKNYLFLFFALLSYHQLHAQNFSNINQYHFGTSSDDFSNKTILCQDGGFMILASSSGGNFDKTEPSFGGSDLWLLRLNADKSIRWQKTLGGDQDDDGTTILELHNGDFLVLSDSRSGVSGNKQSANYGNKDYWVLRLDADGNILWDRSFGSTNSDASSDLISITDSTFLIVGGSNGGQNGTKIQPSFGGFDYWVVAFDAAGNELWQATYGGSVDDYPLDSRSLILATGNLLVLGRSYSDVSGNKTTGAFGLEDSWILEVSPDNGQIVRQASFGGDQADVFYGAVQWGNSIFLAGLSLSDVSGNKQSSLAGLESGWLLEIDTSFQILTDRCFGGSNWANFNRIYPSENGFVAMGSCTDDSNPWVSGQVNGTYDGWLMGFDSTGNYLWNYSFGAVNVVNEAVSDYIELGMNQFMFTYISAFTTASGDVTQPNYGAFDVYLIECSSDLNTGEVFTKDLMIYPNPVKDNLSISGLSNDAYIEIWDMQGNKVYAGSYSQNIDLTNLSAGLFTISVLSNAQVSKAKFVKIP